ncbi:MAG: chemotaxis protein CheA [Gemmatimonadales bacterium]|nr:chemotaxis protein CheA [Gemmatimonadales bacterium]
MATDLSRFRQTFIDESRDGLDAMEAGLLGLERGQADADTINAIFRAAHSIKGGAGTFGFGTIAAFTHRVETLLDEVRAGSRAATAELIAALLAAVDVLRGLIDGAAAGASDDPSACVDVAARLQALLDRQPAVAGPAVPAGPADTAPAGWRIRFAPQPEMVAGGNDPVRLLRELATLGEATVVADRSRLPALEALDPEALHLAWTVTLTGPAATREAILAVFEWVEGECELDVAPLEARRDAVSPASAAPAPTAPPAAGGGGPPAPAVGRGAAAPVPGDATSLRVSTAQLDELGNLVGELVITQSMLGQIGRDFEPRRLEQLLSGLAQLERNTRELQESVMRIRMVPISFAFNRFPRMVHDISARLGKKVHLRVTGEGTELDKTVIEKIGDPLVHLVRNALDHGIEPPEERRAAGKPEEATLTLAACHRGGEIVVEIADDGRGIARERVRAKAVERGIIAADAALSDEQVLDLIWHPGFSTASEVSDLSGRGVGMDVVRRNIQALGGGVELRSREGAGTAVAIRLPLTLAILDGQLARLGAQVFVVPLVSIVESLKIDPGQLGELAGRAQVYRLRSDYIPVLRAADAFGIPASAGSAGGMLMVVESDGRRAGIVVDELLAQQQVVIKSLEANFRAVPGLSGATILGDGTVALILDVPGLIGMTHRGGDGSRHGHPRDGLAVAA